jgi:hypothetical protein
MDPKTNRRTKKRAEASVFEEPCVRKHAKAGLELTVDVANAVDGNANRRRSGLARASTGKKVVVPASSRTISLTSARMIRNCTEKIATATVAQFASLATF